MTSIYPKTAVVSFLQRGEVSFELLKHGSPIKLSTVLAEITAIKVKYLKPGSMRAR